LFSNGSSQDVPLTSTPLNVCACVPEDVLSSSGGGGANMSSALTQPQQGPRKRILHGMDEWVRYSFNSRDFGQICH
jgi:hypothetical protein